jgi:hypothetical protein
MIRHIVLFKLHPGYTCDHPQVASAERLASRMHEEVACLSGWHFGRNISQSPAAYDFAAIGLFDSAEHIAVYLADPFHQKVASAWQVVSEWLVADIRED